MSSEQLAVIFWKLEEKFSMLIKCEYCQDLIIGGNHKHGWVNLGKITVIKRGEGNRGEKKTKVIIIRMACKGKVAHEN